MRRFRVHGGRASIEASRRGPGAIRSRPGVGASRAATLPARRALAFAPVRQRIPADVLLLVTVVFWSFNFTVVKYALTHGWQPLSYSSVRFAVGAALFSAFTWRREGALHVRRSDIALMLGAAVAGIWLNQLSFSYAVRLTTAATVAL